MVNLITIDGSGHKVARTVRNREDFIKACNTPENIRNWDQYRETGEDKYKRALVQVNYNCQVNDGDPLKGNKTVSPFFFYDIDCRDHEECRSIIAQLLKMREELGLVGLAESVGYGVHAVGRRVPGTTILENQVRISMLTHTEMDTNNKENNRVVFHGPINDETTPLLDDALFTESLSDDEAAAEYQRLKKREKQGLEEVPPGAKKANKHYKPWEDGSKAPNSQLTIDNAQTSPAQTSDPFPVTERIRFIARGVMREKGLIESDFLDEGGRHTTVKMFLSGATQLLKKEELNGVLQELMPDHWNDQNIQQLVNDFYQNYTNPNQRLFKYQEQLFTQSRRLGGSEELIVNYHDPPVLLKNNKFASCFEWVIGLYSYPKYSGFDPTFIMAIFYCILFGLMFADAGYGLLFVLIAFIAVPVIGIKGNLKKSIQMFGWCGVSCIVMGILFGGLFGDLPVRLAVSMFGADEFQLALLLDPIKQPLVFLVISIGVGALHLITGMAIKFYMLCKRGKWLDALLDIGLWWVLFAGIALMAAGVTPWLLIGAAVAIVLTGGRNEKKWIMKPVKGLLGLYGLINYGSDLLSYSRILALGLASSIIAQVVNIMGTMGGNTVVGWIMLIAIGLVGHLINIGLNALGTFVHTSRLQYIEFFGKFYEDGGRKFKPASPVGEFSEID